MPSAKVKIEVPNQLPESGLTRVQFKSWKEAMSTYLKQNDDFLPFFNTSDASKPQYGSWKMTEECSDRIDSLDVYDTLNTEEADRDNQLSKRCRDLSSMLSIIARKVDQYDSDDVINCSTGLDSIWFMLETTYDIGRKGVHFLELSKIKYESGEVPNKFYKRVYHHFMDNLLKSGDRVHFKDTNLAEDEKLTPSLLNFILYYTLEKIDNRILAKVKDKWGHVLNDDKCIHDLKDVILKAVPDILAKLDSKDAELNAFKANGQRKHNNSQVSRSKPSSFGRYGSRRGNDKFCRLCQASGCSRRIFTSHNVSECQRWSRKDVQELRVMILDMQVDPNEYPESDSDQSQD